jgi:hypothetical protein
MLSPKKPILGVISSTDIPFPGLRFSRISDAHPKHI